MVGEGWGTREVEGGGRNEGGGRRDRKAEKINKSYFLLNAAVPPSFTSTSRPHRLWNTSGPVTQLLVEPELADSLPPKNNKNTQRNQIRSVA